MPAFLQTKRGQRQDTDSVKLPPKWIFCDKTTIKKDYKKEILTICEEKKGDRSTTQKTIHRAAVFQQHKIIKLCENYNFLAAEAK